MFIVVDLEATCWGNKEESQANKSEIIQIGAVKIDLHKGMVLGTFDMFVRPKHSKDLSKYCTSLTGITTGDVRTAEYFEQVYPKFVEFCGSKYNNTLVGWGAYDGRMIDQTCQELDLELKHPSHYINAAILYKEKHGLKKKKGLAKAIAALGYNFLGDHHNALADALNAARIFTHTLGVELNVSEFEG